MGDSRRRGGTDTGEATQRRARAGAAPARRDRAPAEAMTEAATQTATHAAILAAIRAIPAGQVAAYGAVARRAGLPGRARLVARVLAGSGEHDLPWHRVLRADGCIAFPQGSEAFLTQCARLRAEGVEVDARGRVRAARRAPTLDEALWGVD